MIPLDGNILRDGGKLSTLPTASRVNGPIAALVDPKGMKTGAEWPPRSSGAGLGRLASASASALHQHRPLRPLVLAHDAEALGDFRVGFDEAAEVAGELATDDPLAAMACRTELFAGIVGADSAVADAALDRARAAQMPAEELDLFCAWRQLVFDGETAITLSSNAVPLLAVMLEALLRVQDFEVFEVLLD